MILQKNIVDTLFREAFKNTDEMGGFARFILAYDWAQEHSRTFPTVADLVDIATMIEPEKAQGYRKTPVYFADMSMGAHPDIIPTAMHSLVAALTTLDDGIEDVDKAVREFLVIHPFRDGNGRTAFILRTWLMGNWDHPERLPDYFGEEERDG